MTRNFCTVFIMYRIYFGNEEFVKVIRTVLLHLYFCITMLLKTQNSKVTSDASSISVSILCFYCILIR